METRTHDNNEGLTLIEILVAIALLSIGLMALVASLGTASGSVRETREIDIGKLTAQRIFQSMAVYDLRELATEFGDGTSQAKFWADATGTVSFTEIEDAEIVGVITVYGVESEVPAEFLGSTGMDLDGDGSIGTSVPDSPEMIPVRIEMFLETAVGTTRTVIVHHLLS